MQHTSVIAAEVARFDALAASWWDPSGPMRPLHRMNPARLSWITARIAARFPDPGGVRVLDVGCGAGLAAEGLARRGYRVLGIDAAGEAIEAARNHAKKAQEAGLDLVLDYRAGTAEALLTEGVKFPVISALEVIEHVANPEAFLLTLADLLEPGGLLFLSTLNRTRRSFLVAKLGAEYLLRLLPVGTHDWKKFVTPAELASGLRRAGLNVADIAGMTPSPLTGGWRAGRDLAVNYIAMAQRPELAPVRPELTTIRA